MKVGEDINNIEMCYGLLSKSLEHISIHGSVTWIPHFPISYSQLAAEILNSVAPSQGFFFFRGAFSTLHNSETSCQSVVNACLDFIKQVTFQSPLLMDPSYRAVTGME